jgi:dTDP-4-dehydrorhamnose reductase
MKKVVILGATGMLGSMLLEYFSRSASFDLTATVRADADLALLGRLYPRVNFRFLNAETCSEGEILSVATEASWVINAIGLIKQRIIDTDDQLVERAVRINSLFSFLLMKAAQKGGFKVIQVATDCVYSGSTGRYSETAVHDCHDVYGKTKSLGEVGATSLLNWFLSRDRNSSINGFTNHVWNGTTTLHFAKISKGIIEHDLVAPNRHHVVPEGEITKDGLLRLFAKAYGREDISINAVQAASAVNRTLTTENPDFNRVLWKAAGYLRPPTVPEMIFEIAEYQKRSWGQAADLEVLPAGN